MRSKKAVINAMVNILSFAIIFIPNLIIRKIFIDTLGNDMVGLSSLYTNIIGWLSIVEMGVGTAIIYSLYNPYANKENQKVRAYIRFYGKFYRGIGFVILVIGIAISPLIKYFIKENIDFKLAIIGFILFLLNTFITYMFSHKICILSVAQEEYKVTIGTTVSKLLISVLQYAMFKLFPSFLLYIVIQLMINLIYFIVINKYILKKYPWLNEGSEELEGQERTSLLKNVKAMFMHKIGGLIVLSTDNLVISKFVGLGVLAKYTNYQMIISALQTMVSTGLRGITASIGNMLTEGNKEKAYDIHKKVFFLNFWITSFIVISLYNTLNQFIVIWIGEKQLLDKATFIVILINVYFSLMRGSVERFQDGAGTFYYDRYAPLVEGGINLVTSLILVNMIGISGVFIGTLISNFSVIFWTKPYVVYKYVFDTKLINYFKMYFKYILIALIPLIVTTLVSNLVKYQYDLPSFIVNCVLNVLIINSIYLLIFFKTDEFKYYIKMVKSITKK